MTTRSKPNVVLVITDDQGYGDLGCTGNPVIQTPNIDRFYSDSVRLTDFHVGPTCAPTRAGLLTGHFHNSTGVWHTIGGRSLLRKNEWTLADALGELGYCTGIFGKWHLGDEYPYRPHDRGFQTAVVHGGGGISQTPDYWGNDYFDDTYFANGEPRSFEGYCTDVWFREGIRWIEAHKDEPFFCMIATNAPHTPLNVPQEYLSMYEGAMNETRARFYGMITNIDHNFGILRESLGRLGLEENTIVIFMTDNGTDNGVDLDASGFVTGGYNVGMRGKKGSPYDGGHRVPFFIRWPGGGLVHGSDVPDLAANVDVMPTVLELCGMSVDDQKTCHGKSLAPLLRGKRAHWDERTLVTDSQRVARPIKWRQSAVMTSRWRLINGEELYDIQVDPEQRRNIALLHPEVVQELRSDYDTWWEIVRAQFDDEVPISVGNGDQEALLTAHDWRGEQSECPWNHGQIRAGLEANAYWEIQVEASGTYEVELRRWPKESGHALTDGIEGADVAYDVRGVDPKYRNWYEGGRAMPFTTARLRFGGEEHVMAIKPGDDAVRFTVQMVEGPTHLQTWLADGETPVCGAYYVYVRRLG